MLRIQNLNIAFDEILVENSCIDIACGKIAAIIGKSGSGKTNLLYRIGLISTDTSYDYYYDDTKLDVTKDKISSQFRKNRIGYVFQDNSVINSLTVKENIKLAARISGIELSINQIKKWLEYVDFDKNINSYPKNLSGGEKQKLALACALAKEPDIIIADEPTSSLNEKNRKTIMELLRKIADEGKSVVIATHQHEVIDFVDVVYEIKDKKIQHISGEVKDADTVKQDNDNVKLKYKNYLDYVLRVSKHYKFQKRFVTVLCAVVIAISASLGNYIKNFVLENHSHLNNLSQSEIFVVNKTNGAVPVITDKDQVFTKEQQEGIRFVLDSDNVYDYLEFKSGGKSVYTGSEFTESTLTVIQDGRRNSFVFENNENANTHYSVINYFGEQELYKRLKHQFRLDSSNTIRAYISSSFADELGIDINQNNVVIQMQAAVPVALFDSIYYDSDNEINTINNDLCICEIINVGVVGILNDDVTNTYSNSGNNVIYINHSEMKKIQQENMDKLGEYVGVSNAKWAPRGYVAFAINYNLIGSIQQRIESISPTIKTVCKFKDIVSINKVINSINKIASMVFIGVLAIILIFMAIIQMNSVLARKYEISVLKANGLSKFEIFKLVLMEHLVQAFKISVIGCTISILLTSIINVIFNMGSLVLYMYIILYIIIVALISVSVPTIITLIIFNKFKPDKIMRN